MRSTVSVVLAVAGLANAVTITTSEPALPAIQSAAATTLPKSPVSDVKGVAFDRFYQVWLENTDYDSAANDPNQQWMAKQGIALTNYWAVGHVSEPNYLAAAAGDLLGMDNDNFNQVPANVSSLADLLDSKGISWAEYQQDIPFPGFQGFNYSNQETFANDYVRKHNPLILLDSVTNNDTRLELIKNFTSFERDLQNQALPQWAFFTPNMTNDGHDTNVTFASSWERSWLESVMKNSYFWNNTLILLTFDESKQHTVKNKVFSILVGGAIPENLKGTIDDTFYTHYSTIASVSANWGLPSLGRWDCGANIFEIVANKTGYTNYQVDTSNLYLNQSLDGPLSANSYSEKTSVWPVPASKESCSAGHGVLDSVVKTWGAMKPTYNYTSPFPYDATIDRSTDVAYSKNGTTYVSGVNTTTSSTGTSSGNSTGTGSSSSSATSASTSHNAASSITVSGWFVASLVGGLMLLCM